MLPFLLAGRPHLGPTHRVIHRPWDGEVLHSVSEAGPDELESAAANAASAFASTRRLPGYERARILRETAAALVRRSEEIAASIQEEGGKPIQLARLEVTRAIETLLLCAEQATRIEGQFLPLDATPAGVGRHALVRRVPRGPVLAITPFNFPLNLVCHKVGPAVACGCPLVVKPAEQTPSAALILGIELVNAGWPPSAISVLPADRRVASALVADERFAVLSFTGSDVVGWRMRAEAGRKHVALELGGNASVILDADTDVAAAVPRIAANAYAHAGQTCISVQHVLIHEDLWTEARDALVAATERVVTGDPAAPETWCGPVISAHAADRIQAWTSEAVHRGARRLCGGERGYNLIQPALYTDVPDDTSLSKDEVFGPVAVLRPFRTLDEAISRVNAGRFGLQAGVYTQRVAALWRAAETLQAGGIIHNDVPSFRVDMMPYGGTGDSGVGREGPRWAIEDFTDLRTLVLRTD